MLSWLFNLLSGGLFNSISTTITNITKAISDEKIAQINATTDVEKAQISAKIGQLESQRDVLIADSQSKQGWIDPTIRVLLTLPVVVYLNKFIVWDKVVGSWPNFSTDSLGVPGTYLLMAILGFFFLYSTAKIFK